MMISRSFRNGLIRGLGAPGIMIEHRSYRGPRFDVSVENAWKEVGRYLDDATDEEGKRIGKKTAGSAGNRGRREKHGAAA